MAKDTTILQKILILKRDLNADWTEDLERLNIWDDVSPLYIEFNDRRQANILTAFIWLAYDASSEQIEPHKDRLQNKKLILMKLAGKDCFSKEIYLDTVLGGNMIIDNVIEFCINNQKDWRWTSAISSLEFASKARAKSFTADKESGDMLEMADKRQEKANKLLDELRQEFVDLDAVLEAEGKPKITDRVEDQKDFMSWELFIKQRKFKDAAKEAESKEKVECKSNRKTPVATNDIEEDGPF